MRERSGRSRVEPAAGRARRRDLRPLTIGAMSGRETKTAPSICRWKGPWSRLRALSGLTFHARKLPTEKVESRAKKEEAGANHDREYCRRAAGCQARRILHDAGEVFR